MKNSSCNPRMRQGDDVSTEWSQASYEAWCRKNAAEFISFPEKRVVDLYEVMRSVIKNDFSPVEQRAAVLHWYKGLSVAAAAKKEGTSTANMYRALARGKEKIRLVLKHLIDCEEYRIPVDD
ncbi:MAG: sigma-70 region 4 domain-containing protein [Clostridia bacterium]|nr:sigma-70 region 4 domain-containing protein [Clostridia bacterium]MBQ7101389.1 sigma-70 region 4 domain-containing protein [Clostridia bacterium]